MRRVLRSWPLLVLLAVAGLLGPPATASASDAGLRTLVSEQRAVEKTVEKRLEAAADRIGSPNGLAQLKRRLGRFLRTTDRLLVQIGRSYDEYRRRFAAEGPETPEADRGRNLVLLGLRDASASVAPARRVTRRLARAVRRARTAEAIVRTAERLDGVLSDRRTDRGESRLKRGRTLIRNAPAPTVPAV